MKLLRGNGRRLRTGGLAIVLAIVLTGCTAFNGPNYHVDTNGPGTIWLTIQGRATSQIASGYQLLGGNVDALADNLHNVKVPDVYNYEVCAFSICATLFTVRVKALWDNLLNTHREQLGGNVYGILLIGTNIDTGGPCLRGIADVDVGGHELDAAGWGSAGKQTDTCGGGEIFSND